MRISSKEVQKDFERYLNFAIIGEEIVVTKNGKDAEKLVSHEFDSLLAEEVAYYSINQNSKVSYEEFIELTKNSELR